MIPEVSIREGWVWPTKDTKCWPWLNIEKDLPATISKYSKDKTVAIQAGGNCGFYTKMYADMFDTVYTFEPDAVNFYCLVMNLGNYPSVYKQQACLGDTHKPLGLSTSKKNVGAYAVTPEVQGVIPTLMIDDLGLDKCDLIHLDIEGWEFPALRGATNTLKNCHPVVALEWMDHGAKFGFPQDDIHQWMLDHGYSKWDDIMNERIYY